MVIGIGELISTTVSSFVVSIFVYIVLKIMRDDRSFLRVLIVVIVANVAMIFLPYISTIGIPIPWYAYFIISIVISLLIYKYGLDLTWLRTLLLVILTPIITAIIGIILVFLGLGALIGLASFI